MSDAPEWIKVAKSDQGGWSTFAAHEDDAIRYVRADRLEAIEAENRRLRDALQPFAKAFEKARSEHTPTWEDRKGNTHVVFGWNRAEFTLGMFQAARAALSTDGGEARALQSPTEGDET